MRVCAVPGCSNRVAEPRHWVCPSCYAQWCKDGVPEWLQEVIRLARLEEYRAERARSHEVSLELLLDHTISEKWSQEE